MSGFGYVYMHVVIMIDQRIEQALHTQWLWSTKCQVIHARIYVTCLCT